MEQTSLLIAVAMRSTTRSSLACADPRRAIMSWSPVKISRAEVAAVMGIGEGLAGAGGRCHVLRGECPLWVESGHSSEHERTSAFPIFHPEADGLQTAKAGRSGQVEVSGFGIAASLRGVPHRLGFRFGHSPLSQPFHDRGRITELAALAPELLTEHSNMLHPFLKAFCVALNKPRN